LCTVPVEHTTRPVGVSKLWLELQNLRESWPCASEGIVTVPDVKITGQTGLINQKSTNAFPHPLWCLSLTTFFLCY
jgi:hypothetical protein